MHTTVILADRVIDATGRAPIEGGGVCIRHGRIIAVGRRADLSIPEDAEIIERPGETLVPGLVDAHSHVSIIPGLGHQIGQLRERAAKAMLRALPNMRTDLLSGVTTMRVMGEEHFLDVDLKAAIAAGHVPGPRLIVSTRPIAATHGHGTALTASDGPETIRRHIRENLAAGADFIKFFATGGTSSARAPADACFYSAEEINLIVAEAHRDGKRAAVHAHGGPAIRLCVEAGVDTIEHGKLATAEDFALMRQANTWLVTNNAIAFHPDGIEKGDAHTPEIMAKLHRARAAVPAMFRRLLESGVRWALGTDSMHGLLWFEAQKAVEFGASPEQALTAVTRNAADASGVLDQVGTLEPGKRADVITVRGNPLTDITALRAVGLILQDGVRRDTLSAG